MRIDWKSERTRDDLNIPADYLNKDAGTQDRREVTFILQEAAFGENIPLYCAVDVDKLTGPEKDLYTCDDFTVHGALILGLPIREELLFMEQVIPGWSLPDDQAMRVRKQSCDQPTPEPSLHTDTMAGLWVKNRLLDFSERLAVMGYQTHMIEPVLTPDPEFAVRLAASRKGFAGRSGRFVTPDCGPWVCLGVILTDAPLMGGDYRYADYSGEGCGDCRACLDACPAGALSESGVDVERCVAWRDDPENQKEVAAFSYLKCYECLRVCPVGRAWYGDSQK